MKGMIKRNNRQVQVRIARAGQHNECVMRTCLRWVCIFNE